MNIIYQSSVFGPKELVDIWLLVSVEMKEFALIIFVYPSHAPAGVHSRLAAVLYEPGSLFDLYVRDAQAADQDVFLVEAGSAIKLVTPTSGLNDTVGTAGPFRNTSLTAIS